jgi:hypothetical protein
MARKTAVEGKKERRKKTTLRLIKREHAGEVTEPYVILDELIDKFHPALAEAKFILFWKTGWKADKDGILTRASIRKATEADRERHGDCDYMIFLHRELWQCKGFSPESRRHDLDHELCHAAAEIDDSNGKQRIDERDRLCWRIVKHKIQSFPELVARYGLDAATGIDGESLLKQEGQAAKQEAEAIDADKERPLLAAADTQVAPWRAWTVSVLGSYGLPAGKMKLLEDAGLSTMGKLVDAMNRQGQEDFWWKSIRGLGEGGYDALTTAVAKLREARPEFQAEAA